MTGKALAAAAAAAVALLAAGSAEPRVHAPAKGLPLLGIVTDRASGQSLVRVDPHRLRALPDARIDLSGYVSGWAFSPDKRVLALGRSEKVEDSFRDAEASVRLVDPYAMSVVADLPLGRGPIHGSAMAWLAPDRIVAIAWDCCTDDVDLVVADPVARRVVERHALHADPLQALRADDRLVVLAAQQEGIGPVKLLLIDAEGTIQSVVLDRIEGGSERIGEGSDVGVNDLRPALTVQPDGRRAFVFSPTGLAAEVDLPTAAVTYHILSHGRLVPAVRAKRYLGSSRWAQALGNGLVALTGSTSRPYTDKTGKEQVKRLPAGLELVDVRDWSTRTIDPNADSFAFARDRLLTRDMLLATGSRWDSGTGALARGSGLSAYTLTGERTFRLFKGKGAAVAGVYGTRAFVSLGAEEVRVVNLVSGRVIGKRDYKTVPWLILP